MYLTCNARCTETQALFAVLRFQVNFFVKRYNNVKTTCDRHHIYPRRFLNKLKKPVTPKNLRRLIVLPASELQPKYVTTARQKDSPSVFQASCLGSAGLEEWTCAVAMAGTSQKMGVRKRSMTASSGFGIRSFRTRSYTGGSSSSSGSSTNKATGVPRKSKEVEFDMFKVCTLVLRLNRNK